MATLSYFIHGGIGAALIIGLNDFGRVSSLLKAATGSLFPSVLAATISTIPYLVGTIWGYSKSPYDDINFTINLIPGTFIYLFAVLVSLYIASVNRIERIKNVEQSIKESKNLKKQD